MNTLASEATKAQQIFDNETLTVLQAFQSFFSAYQSVMRKERNGACGGGRQMVGGAVHGAKVRRAGGGGTLRRV
jgi:hypothetical protein